MKGSHICVGETDLADKSLRARGSVGWELKETARGPEFSAMGNLVVWKVNKVIHESSGQNLDTLLGVYANDERLRQIVEVWRVYHLNGMRAGCEHQRALGWRPCPGHHGVKGEETCSKPLPPRQPREDDYPLGHPPCIGPEHFGKYGLDTSKPCAIRECRKPFEDHFSAYQKEENKRNQEPYRCEEDALGKPCPTCGYKYGHEWKYIPIPDNILALIRSWNGGAHE
jgi:hypothetical protein